MTKELDRPAPVRGATYWRGWTRITYDPNTGFWVTHSPLAHVLAGLFILVSLAIPVAVEVVTGVWWLALLALVGIGIYDAFLVLGNGR